MARSRLLSRRPVDPDQKPFDRRLMDPGFLERPKEIQDLIRSGLAEEDGEWEQLSGELRGRHRHTLLEGTLLFASVEALAGTGGLPGTVVAALIGLALGEIWHRGNVGQLGGAISGACTSMAHHWVLVGTSPLTMFVAPFWIGAIAGYLGHRRETR